MTLDRFVFLDEFGATTDVARCYARGPRGERVVCKKPHGHWKVLRLPPYSPDFNPIEMAISKIKAVLRKLARRTVDSLLAAIDEAVAYVTAQDALHFIRHCG